MNSNQADKNATSKAQGVMFDHEKLDVYQFELRFIVWVTALLDEVSALARGKTREVCDQLDRASLSALLNTAEGNGKRQRPVRAKFFDDARGSATECAGCLDAMVAKQVATQDRVVEGKQMLLRIVSMLCGLIDRFDSPMALREGPCECESVKMPVAEVRYTPHSSRTRTRRRPRTERI